MGKEKVLSEKVKMVITGGHHTPALAVTNALRQGLSSRGLTACFYWFGHQHSMRGDRNQSLEYKDVSKSEVFFYNLRTARFHRNLSFGFIFYFLAGFVQSFFLLLRIRPKIIISFGGYLAVPVILAGSLLGIPCVTHEQTSTAGFGNRLISKFCRKIFVSFASSLLLFPRERTVFTGNPLRAEVLKDGGHFKFNNGQKTIYITGGKQGSHKINQAVKGCLLDLLKNYNVIHQTGASSLFDDFNNFEEYRKQSLPKSLAGNYVLRDHLWASEVGSALARADLVVSRSGANIVYELAVLGKMAVLIPLEGSSHREQEKNADLLRNLGQAEIIREDQLSSGTLLKKINELVSHKSSFVRDRDNFGESFPKDAAYRMAAEIVKIVG